jgi:hypothetical protein
MALMMTNNMGKPKEAVPYVRKLLEVSVEIKSLYM